MKKFIYTVIFAIAASVAVSSCTEDNVKPRETTQGSTDPCAFGGPGCK